MEEKWNRIQGKWPRLRWNWHNTVCPYMGIPRYGLNIDDIMDLAQILYGVWHEAWLKHANTHLRTHAHTHTWSAGFQSKCDLQSQQIHLSITLLIRMSLLPSCICMRLCFCRCMWMCANDYTVHEMYCLYDSLIFCVTRSYWFITMYVTYGLPSLLLYMRLYGKNSQFPLGPKRNFASLKAWLGI